MHRFLIWLASGLAAGLLPAAEVELKPQISRAGKLLVQEDFSAGKLPAGWQPGGRPNSFSVEQGALKGVCAPDDGHGPSLSIPVEGRNLVIAFDFKHAKPGYFLFLVDGESQFGGKAHLLRVGLGPTGVVVQQDRGSPESKRAQKTARDQAARDGKSAPAPTKEQLADPKFYRTERLAAKTAKFDDDAWHHAMIEVQGNQVVVQVDGTLKLEAAGTVLEAGKSSLVFLVGKAGTTLVDNVRVWESSLSPPLRP